MNKVDKEYCNLLKEILDFGRYKSSRAGETISLFGKTMRFDLQDGLPLLTTKRVYYKGIIHELLWFLSGNTNIKYLVDNNVHIWDDDAYRYYLELVKMHNSLCIERDNINIFKRYYTYENLAEEHDDLNIGGDIIVGDFEDVDDEDAYYDYSLKDIEDEHEETDTIDAFGNGLKEITPISKEEFLENVKNNKYEPLLIHESSYTSIGEFDFGISDYRYGDLGPVYGKQWRNFGKSGTDQIQKIINTLKTNPDDRRMLCIAFNPDVLEEVALPPCHMLFQFYTYELQPIERLEWLCKHSNGEYDEWKSVTHEQMDELNVPRRTLSCSFTMRSNDICCGTPFNIAQYAMLTYMLCEVCNMIPGELIYYAGDAHVYTNHITNAREQLSRNGSEIIPKLKFTRKVNDINDFKFEDFIVEDYYPDAAIKYELNVGL